jgi:asparagine synthase (glutamine-hydrolysing)
MCGIIGHYSGTEQRDDSGFKTRMLAGMKMLSHRGPNDHCQQSYALRTGELLLGHRRLSIIDLTSAGRQPMHSPDGRYAIVFNGEIYNYLEIRELLKREGHVFGTETDAEVLIASWAHWGKNSLKMLRGMFSMAILDKCENTLTCVRDPFGIKPFYYQRGNDTFDFASEPGALITLLGSEPTCNETYIIEFLRSGSYDTGENTFYAGINQLPAAHLLIVDFNKKCKIEIQRWWNPDIDEQDGLSFSQAADELRHLVLQSLTIHLRSDVPIGAALSGGIDSSALVCSMRHLRPEIPIHTFSYIAKNSSVDESQWIDIVNSHVNATSHKAYATGNDFVDQLDSFIGSQGEPVSGPSYFAEYLVYQLAEQCGIRVMLDGHGADEVFAGYKGYLTQRLQSLVELGNYSDAFRFVHHWLEWPGRTKIQAFDSMVSAVFGACTGKELHKLFVENLFKKRTGKMKAEADSGIGIHRRARSLPGRRLSECLLEQLTATSCPPQLRSADRSAMARSIENRVPFLNIDIVEFALRLPEKYLVAPNGETKSVFRSAMRGIVPDAILQRKDKVGYAIQDQFVKANAHGIIQTLKQEAGKSKALLGALSRARAYSDVKSELLINNRSWRAMNLLLWMNKYSINLK